MLLFLSGVGSYPCSISNSLKASKLTINEAVAPIEDFNQKYLPHVAINICLLFTTLEMLTQNSICTPVYYSSLCVSMAWGLYV